MGSSLMSLLAETTIQDLERQIKLDSQILTEQFYFFTVVVMWLIHAGFMAYEAGIARRKNVMSTAMKNILTIAVVTPTFYYFGWYVYGCFQEGWPKSGHASPDALPGFCGLTAPWSAGLGPNLQDHVSLVFFLAFLLFSWTTGSIMSGALIERVRLSAYLMLTIVLGSFVWIMDAAWGWSSGGWLVTRFGFHDAIASLVVHGVAGAFTLGVLLNLGPRIGKYDVAGRARSFRPHNTHMTLLGLMLIFTGFYGFYAACLVIQSTVFPGWLNIYLSPTTLGAIAMVITIGFAGGFTGAWFASKGDPFWTLSGGLAGVIAVSAGADVYHPSLAYLLAASGGMLAVWVGTWIEKKLRLDDAVGAVAVHGFCGFYGVFLVGIFAGGYPTGINNIPVSFGGQLMGMMAFLPLAFLPGYVLSWVLKKLNLLRVPPEVELEGLDLAEFQQDFYPEFERVPEVIVTPDGDEVEAAPILLDAYHSATRKQTVKVGA
ncbi:Ammonia permease [Gaiella occulta]|uniref:Ammonia permease n=1 Tax=Gaiella occulta TaxID=1002870 RepID=A0A7M2Z203_9ACTN|nr:ammonium transporter [Gaiella occulta]RDI76115.1 Ammonia permease [Gaiella occulta]